MAKCHYSGSTSWITLPQEFSRRVSETTGRTYGAPYSLRELAAEGIIGEAVYMHTHARSQGQSVGHWLQLAGRNPLSSLLSSRLLFFTDPVIIPHLLDIILTLP